MVQFLGSWFGHPFGWPHLAVAAYTISEQLGWGVALSPRLLWGGFFSLPRFPVPHLGSGKQFAPVSRHLGEEAAWSLNALIPRPIRTYNKTHIRGSHRILRMLLGKYFAGLQIIRPGFLDTYTSPNVLEINIHIFWETKAVGQLVIFLFATTDPLPICFHRIWH